MQETGIGFYYSENFNTFRELGESIRNRFSSEKRKRRRAERRAERESVRQAAKELGLSRSELYDQTKG